MMATFIMIKNQRNWEKVDEMMKQKTTATSGIFFCLPNTAEKTSSTNLKNKQRQVF